MVDIIWGNGSHALSGDSFELNVTHRKNGNKNEYSDIEKIKIISADLPGFPLDQKDWKSEVLNTCITDAFLKCEIDQRGEGNILHAKVSHSGVGGY